jgi:shikimate kinase
MKNLVLFGFMGSGKTTVGKWAAERLGMSFVDMDDLLEQRQGRSIAHIFSTQGEPQFRKLERELVRELAAGCGQVIATGGGVVLDRANVEDFSRSGVVVCLWAEPRVVYRRTKHARHRPLMEGADRYGRIKQLFHQRAPLYKSLPHLLDTSEKGLEQVVNDLIRIYKQAAAGESGGGNQTSGARAGL